MTLHPRQGFGVCPHCWRGGTERLPERWEPIHKAQNRIEELERATKRLLLDWDALLVEIALAVGDDDDREAAEMGEIEEFDPWHALRRYAADRDSLRSKLSDLERENWTLRKAIDQLTDTRDKQALHITHLVMQLRGKDWHGDVVSAREERDRAFADAERMRVVYDAARTLTPTLTEPVDWACAECRPNSDMLHLKPGWRCAVHVLRAAFAKKEQP
jgi:hypothetical protein